MESQQLNAEINRERVQKILSDFALPPEIEAVEPKYGVDHTGDPAVFLTFTVKKDIAIKTADIKRLTQFIFEVTSALFNGEIGGFAYTRLDQAA